METYQEEYDEFLKNHKLGQVYSAQDIGEIIVRFANYFAQKNLFQVIKENALRRKAAEIISSVDGLSKKPISAAKADILISATPEAEVYREAKAHLENLNTMINAMKSLQKGMGSEFGQSGSM